MVDDRSGRGKFTRFTQRYIPRRIGVANAMDRRRDMGIEPIFREANDGNYYAVAVEGNTTYAVVPRFALTLQEDSYGPGAMGQVFDCPGYNPQESYPNVKVAKPAIFEFDPDRQQWEFRDEGELDIGKQVGRQILSLETDAAKRTREIEEEDISAWAKEAKKQTSAPWIKEKVEEICLIYNAAVDDLSKGGKRNEFMGNYGSIRIGVAIDSERSPSRDRNVMPVFRRSDYGDLYALPIEGSTSYAVVPRFALELQESNYESSAIGQVFECPGYNSQENYPNVKVIEPALFESDPGKQQWEIKNKGRLDLGTPPILEDVIDLYNTTIDNPSRQDEFEQRYKPIRIDVTNAADLLQDPDIKPIFQTSDDDDYLAVAVEGDTSYAVVPRSGLTLQEFINDTGAMEHVFNCSKYDKQFRFQRLKVAQPALLDPVDAAKERWELTKKGELYLGEGIEPIEPFSSEADKARPLQNGG